jgi:predicted extracellular nuclease
MKITVFTSFTILCLTMAIGCQKGQNVTTKNRDNQQLVIGFYNVENLFDLTNDPATNDEDFTPTGKLQWNEERYLTKLSHIAQVMDSLPGALPIAMGLCEIENRSVLNDLIKQNKIAAGQYQVVHKDSPDERGIDVALLYRSDIATLKHEEYLTIQLPSENDPFTRDILYCILEIAGEEIHLFVNHWPSRSGGQAESEINRITAAQVLGKRIDEIVAKDTDAKILAMGDFNDHPADKSIAEYLHAGAAKPSKLYTYMADAALKNEGTHFYKGEWGALDQFIGSWSLVESAKGLRAPMGSQNRFFDDLVLFRDKEGQARPNRTYVGDSYKNGYSDHLAIYMQIQL